ncbi:hypothetical protein GXW71_24895 [Roseomonas hellenica]|uniref:Uncharacterized protein n=1 Tax=Plastoroseomonas hellenica TaxID=2687306 RepID=A0ABS5F534_9PROT|nr:hypothetical protein [Plastoroseomonas hellenica]MBR0667616.1 hypothetical protein [Plastoroseomonas hellenica]
MGVAPPYRKLVEIIAKAAGDGGRRTVLIWPASEISLAASAVLTCLADCLAATAIEVVHDGEKFSALSTPIGLRTLLFPAASTVHRPLKDVYADKTTIARCHTQHHVRAIRYADQAGLADYHQALSRVKTLTGRARDGRVYDEFRHPNLDEMVASGPLSGPVPDHGHLLWHARSKTDLRVQSRTGLADDPKAAPYFAFSLRADDAAAARINAAALPLDALLLDLTRRGRARLGLHWRERIRELTAKVEAAHRGIGVVALTDDPWTFDAVRFEALAIETRVRARVERKPCLSEVVFAVDSAVAAPAQETPTQWRGCERIAVEGFGGDLVAEVARLRSLATTATDAGDLRGAEIVRRLIGRLRRAASLPASLGALSDYVTEEMGSAVAAEQVAAYQVNALIADLTEPSSVLSQVAYDDLTASVAKARELRGKVDLATPMSSLVEAAVRKYLGSSSKCLFVFRSDLIAELAYDDLASRLPDLEARIDNGMIHFTDVQGAADIASLPDAERNHFFRMVLVGPTRAQLLGWMAKPWLPKELLILLDLDTIRSTSRDALRLSEYPEFSSLQQRLSLLAQKTREAASRLGGAAINLDSLEAPPEDVEVPLGSVVDMAGPSRTPRDLIEFTLSNDLTVIARPRTRLVSKLPSQALVSYGETEASKVGKGDEICVMGRAFIEKMRPLLNISAVAAEEIRTYHDLVREKFDALMPGQSVSARLRVVSEKMGLPRVEPATIRYWVTLHDEADKALHDVVPHAPRDRETFLRFMAALGLSDGAARRFWAWAVIAQRSVRQRVGAVLYDAYRSILVDPHGADASQLDRLTSVKAVRSAAEQFVATVTARREFRG